MLIDGLYWYALLLQQALSHLSQGRISTPSIDATHAIATIATLQQWYNEDTGLWDTTGWWNSANALTMLGDFGALDDSLDSVTQHVFENTFQKAQVANIELLKVMTSDSIESYIWSSVWANSSRPSTMSFPGFINEYYDDEGWWALAWLKIYDITKKAQYLSMAISIFEDMITGYTAPCGGMWWDKAHTYTGAIENELFLAVAAQLANRAPTPSKQYYLDWALTQWDWFQRSGMITPQFTINNGINLTTCQNDGGTIWSYNQGVILGGLLELHKAVPDDVYLVAAVKIALAGVEHLSDSNGILHEPCEPNCGADGPQFKGIFMRNLQTLQKAIPIDRVENFIRRNAESIWLNDRGDGHQLGLVWSGPFTGATASTQSSACDALVAAMAGNDRNSNMLVGS